MMTGSIRIVADDREQRSGVIDAISGRADVEVILERLPVGDFDLDGRVRIERKTLPDLVASIKEGRLFRQALALRESNRWCGLILEGTARDLAGSEMRREAIQGALITLTLFLGIPILRSLDPAETAKLLLYIARQGRRFSHDGPRRGGRLPRGKRRLQLYLLQGLPGIGPSKAARLLDRFGSVEAVFTASPDALREVEGIGAVLADTIRWSVNEASEDYLEPLSFDADI